MSEQEQKLGITGCEAPCGGHPLRPLEDSSTDTEAEDYFSALDFAFERYKSPEKISGMPKALVVQRKSWWRRVSGL